MSETVHNPDRHMADLRTIIAQGRKRIAFLIGSGAPASMAKPGTSERLIPTVDQLTARVMDQLKTKYGAVLEKLGAEAGAPNIEAILSRARALASVIGDDKVHGIDGAAYGELCEKICAQISEIVTVRLPEGPNPYRHLVSWITGTDRDHPVEIFTTNYDLLFEETFEARRSALFDGFTGSREPFFDAVSVASNDLPPRWTRLWKLHGSIGWQISSVTACPLREFVARIDTLEISAET